MHRNPKFGFDCLHYNVMESQRVLSIQVENRTGEQSRLGIRTVDGEAVAGTDYVGIDSVIEFESGKKT